MINVTEDFQCQKEYFFSISFTMRKIPSYTFPKQALVFTSMQYKSFENTVGKGEIAHNEQFLLFPQCFLTIWIAFCRFHQILNCRLQTLSVWKSLKFIVCQRVKLIFSKQRNFGLEQS